MFIYSFNLETYLNLAPYENRSQTTLLAKCITWKSYGYYFYLCKLSTCFSKFYKYELHIVNWSWRFWILWIFYLVFWNVFTLTIQFEFSPYLLSQIIFKGVMADCSMCLYRMWFFISTCFIHTNLELWC